jgi:FAD-linked oxidoreductase
MITRRKILMGGVGAVALTAGGLTGRRMWLDREVTPPPPIKDGKALWSNWSGIQQAYPAQRAAPANEGELAALLPSAKAPIRPVGAGHSFTALVPTSGTLLSIDRMEGIVSHNARNTTAVVRAGTKLSALGKALASIGQEMPNLPDVDKQTLAGAIATGTHGTGKGLRALHGGATAMRIVTPAGEVISCSREERPELFHSARVGLGAFGIISEVTLQNAPIQRIKKTVRMVDTDEALRQWPELVGKHRNVEFLVLPFTGKSALITADPTDEPVKPRGPDQDADAVMQLKSLRDMFEFTPAVRKRVAERLLADAPPEVAIDESWKLLANERPIRFNELEYHLPIDQQIGVLREVIARIERDATDVFFPIEARIVAPDDAWLSPFHDRECGSIAVHAYYKDPYDWLQRMIEPMMREAGGRPHWGKLHSLSAKELRALYPMFDEAMAVRRAIDPQGRLLNPFLTKLFVDG